MTDIDQIHNILKPSEIIDASSPSYISESLTWDAQRNLHPKIIAKPENVTSLSSLIRYLTTSDLDFAIRCKGVGNASAKDVLVNLSNFKEFEFHPEDETILIGAGHSWKEIEVKLEAVAPEYAALSTRCSFAGVGGSILHGGISFLSSEHGLMSDPHNLLDAQVVKLDGDIVWASKDPDLFWALRGGGGCFGVVTAFKLKVYRCSRSIYSGTIRYPRSSLPVVAREVSKFASREDPDPKTAMHLYCLDLFEGSFVGRQSQSGIAILVFDANGEEHGRSDKGFKWALDIEGAVDATHAMSLKEANGQADELEVMKGGCDGNMSAITFTEVTEEMIMRAWKWWEDTISIDPRFRAGTFVLIELMQKPTFHSVKSAGECAWPRLSQQHLLQLGAGRPHEGDYPSDVDARVFDALKNAGEVIIGEKHSARNYFPHCLQEFNDISAVYDGNYERLKELQEKYDPSGRLIENMQRAVKL